MKIRELERKELERENPPLKEKEIDEMADEIVELILSSVAAVDSKKLERIKRGGREATKSTKTGTMGRKTLMEILRLKNRINALENRMEKYIKNFKIASIEANRLISEKAEEARDENEQMLFDLQGQIEDLRAAMTRLSNEVRKLSGK